MALLSSPASAIAVVLCCRFWIGTGWPDGVGGADDGRRRLLLLRLAGRSCAGHPAVRHWTAVAVALMAVYQFAVLPMVHDFEMLALALAPAFLLVGV